uniref:Uncharacterized protein n=1 Tax=Anguilla anguilla TaxID=7936 RepID=A0A0E9PRE2_ANGAN
MHSVCTQRAHTLSSWAQNASMKVHLSLKSWTDECTNLQPVDF